MYWLDTNSSEPDQVIPFLDKLTQSCLFLFAAFSTVSISATQISFSIGTTSWLLKVYLTHSRKDLIGTRVGIAILFFCLACCLATITAVDFESSFKQLKKLLQFIIFFWVANAVQNEKQRDLLINIVIVAGVGAALNGFSGYWDISNKEVARIHGTSSNVATFSGIMMLTGLVTLGRILFSKPKEKWVLVSGGIIIFCLLLTLTRQTWLGFFVGATILIFFWNKKFIWIIPLFLAGLLLFGPKNIKDRLHSFKNIQENSFQSRVILWQGGWTIFKDYPLTGCGFKCVDSIHTQYPDPKGYLAFYRGLHSNVFQLLVDTGIIGLAVWISIWISYFIEIFKRWRSITEENSQHNGKGVLIGSMAAVVGFLIGGLFESNIYDSEVSMLLYFFMGISLANVKKPLLTKPDSFIRYSFSEKERIIPLLDKAVQTLLFTFVAFSMFSISVTQISFSLGVLAWLLKIHLTKSWKEINWTALGWPILCFCLASILAVLTAVEPENSLKPLKKILQFAVFFWVANNVADENQKDLLLKLLILAGVIASLFGFSQAWTNALGLQNRVSGTMSVYMTFAGVLMLVGLVASSRAFFQDTKEPWIIFAVVIIGSCLLLTLTRQAWLGFFIGLTMLIFSWNKKYLLSLPFLLILLLLFSPESVKDRIFSLVDFKDWTLQARFYLWQGGLEIFKDHPISGCGFKCVDIVHSQYPDPSGYIAKYRGMHSNMIQLLVDTGILGLITWLSIWTAYFLTIYKKFIVSGNTNSKGLALGVAAATMGFLAGGMFETNFYDSEVVMLLYFLMGISLAPTRNNPVNQS